MLEMKKKVCKKCSVEQYAIEFNPGYSRCRACVKAYNKEKRSQDKLLQWSKRNGGRNLMGR